MSAPTFKMERATIRALLEVLADMAPSGKTAGPLTCTRILDGGDTDCDDAGVVFDGQCFACRVFSSLRAADEALAVITEREFGRDVRVGCADCGKPIQGKPVYFMGTSARCAECHAKRGGES